MREFLLSDKFKPWNFFSINFDIFDEHRKRSNPQLTFTV